MPQSNANDSAEENEDDDIPNSLHDDDEEVPIPNTLSTHTSKHHLLPPKLGEKAVSIKVSRKFGKLGIFTGKVVAYDNEDALYSIQYTDGDVEDFDEGEYLSETKKKKQNYDSASDDDFYTVGEKRQTKSPSSKNSCKMCLPLAVAVLWAKNLLLCQTKPSTSSM